MGGLFAFGFARYLVEVFTMKQQFVPGNDPYERFEFDSTTVKTPDQQTGAPGVPKLTIRTNSGQSLEFKLTGSSSELLSLAEWAIDAARDLAAQGR